LEDERMSFAVICYPELRLSDYYLIQEIRARYDTDNYKLIKPHFTFVFPFSGVNRDDLLNHVDKCIGKTSRINFKLCRTDKVADISGDKWFLFLEPDEGYDKIVKIHDALYTGPLADYLRSDIPYKPHITVGVFESKEACERVINDIDAPGFLIRGWITTIEVISINNNNIETLHKYNLV
jgi:2'-5' RNA ligase